VEQQPTVDRSTTRKCAQLFESIDDIGRMNWSVRRRHHAVDLGPRVREVAVRPRDRRTRPRASVPAPRARRSARLEPAAGVRASLWAGRLDVLVAAVLLGFTACTAGPGASTRPPIVDQVRVEKDRLAALIEAFDPSGDGLLDQRDVEARGGYGALARGAAELDARSLLQLIARLKGSEERSRLYAALDPSVRKKEGVAWMTSFIPFGDFAPVGATTNLLGPPTFLASTNPRELVYSWSSLARLGTGVKLGGGWALTAAHVVGPQASEPLPAHGFFGSIPTSRLGVTIRALPVFGSFELNGGSIAASGAVQVQGYDGNDFDAALVRGDQDGAGFRTFRRTSDLVPGATRVWAIGNTSLADGRTWKVKIAAGTFGGSFGVNFRVEDIDLSEGFSGGAFVTDDGELVGIIFGNAAGARCGFGVTSEALASLLDAARSIDPETPQIELVGDRQGPGRLASAAALFARGGGCP
jgi:trypsin-like peptidase